MVELSATGANYCPGAYLRTCTCFQALVNNNV